MLVPGGIANSPAWIRRSSPEYRAPNRKIRASEIAPASSRMPEARSMLAPRGIATSAGASSGPSPRHWLAPQPATTARPSTSRISSVRAFAATWRTGSPRLAEHQRGVGAAEAEGVRQRDRSEEHTSELQSLRRISYAVFCLKKKKKDKRKTKNTSKKQKQNNK